MVAEAAFQEVAAQMAVRLAMADGRLDGGAAPEFAFDLAVDAALLPGPVDPVRVRRIVADIAFVGAVSLMRTSLRNTRQPRFQAAN